MSDREKLADEIVLDGGKYRFYLSATGGLVCDRYGKPWREFIGDHATHLLFQAALRAPSGDALLLQECRAWIEDAQEKITGYTGDEILIKLDSRLSAASKIEKGNEVTITDTGRLVVDADKLLRTPEARRQIDVLRELSSAAASAGEERLVPAYETVATPEGDKGPLDPATLEAAAKFIEHYCTGSVPASTIALYLPNKIRALTSERT